MIFEAATEDTTGTVKVTLVSGFRKKRPQLPVPPAAFPVP